MKWTITYDNDTGQDDESFWEWWEITDGYKTFKAETEEYALWLAETLNKIDP